MARRFILYLVIKMSEHFLAECQLKVPSFLPLTACCIHLIQILIFISLKDSKNVIGLVSIDEYHEQTIYELSYQFLPPY